MDTEHYDPPEGPFEKTEPKTAIIVFFAIVSVVTIALLQPAFGSYFDSVMGKQEQEQRVELPAYYRGYRQLEAEQKAALEQSRLPLSRAMERVAQNRSGIPLLRPVADQDLQALAGWNNHPDYEAPPAPDETPTADPEPTDGSEDSAEAEIDAGDTAPAPPAQPTVPTMGAPAMAAPAMAAPAMAASAMAAPAMAASAMAASAMAAPAMAAPASPAAAMVASPAMAAAPAAAPAMAAPAMAAAPVMAASAMDGN